jgi:hypothetical protein
MEITQETVDGAAATEQQIIRAELQVAQLKILNDRVVMLRAYATSLEKLLDEAGIDYTIEEKKEPRKPTDRRRSSKTTQASKTKKSAKS